MPNQSIAILSKNLGFILDPLGRCVYASKRLALALQCRTTELLDLAWLNRLHPEGPAWSRATMNDPRVKSRTFIQTRSGTVALHTTLETLLNPDGSVAGHVGKVHILRIIRRVSEAIRA
jgi:hypothetical protein